MHRRPNGFRPNGRTKFCDVKCDLIVSIFTLLVASSALLEGVSSSRPANSVEQQQQQQQQQQQFSTAQLLPIQSSQSMKLQNPLGIHLQPAFVYGPRNRSINFTHLAYDELTNSVYLGATNWLFQLSAANLRPESALKTGPAVENQRDCAPADCAVNLASVDLAHLAFHHGHGSDLSIPAPHQSLQLASRASRNASLSLSAGSNRPLGAPRPGQSAEPQPTTAPSGSASSTQALNNNYNKILAIDHESRQLIVCGSLNQGACRKHQLGQLANFSDLIPLPVASNDEQSSTAALIVPSNRQRGIQSGVMYVAATHPRHGSYRDMVPAISARWLEPKSKAMQIIESSSIDSARIDISFELRDYYLVNYAHAFQHQDHVYFVTVQRKSPLIQLEEWGYVTRLARLCLSDLSFQSYAEINLECRARPAGRVGGSGQQQASGINYNLLQDAQLTQASSHLATQLGVRPQSAVLVGAFAQSKDHTAKSQAKSAVCLYPMERIEQTFNENIQSCLNGSLKSRNMNYIAGSVNDCPRSNGRAANLANICNEPIKLNGSIPLVASPVISFENELITSIASIQAPTSPLNHQSSASAGSSESRRHAYQPSSRQHQVLLVGTSDAQLKRILLAAGSNPTTSTVRGLEFDSVQLEHPSSVDSQDPILSDLLVLPNQNLDAPQFALAATPNKLVKLRINGCRAASMPNLNGRNQSVGLTDQCMACAQLQDPFCGWCSSSNACLSRADCIQQQASSGSIHWQPFDQIRCADYQPVWPQFVPVQSATQQPIEVNVRLEHPPTSARSSEQQQQQQQQQQPVSQSGSPLTANAFALQLSRAQFNCHFDYLTYANRSLNSLQSRISGATTKSTQARLNLHSSTVSIACPLPSNGQRPQAGPLESRVKLLVRLAPPLVPDFEGSSQLAQVMGMKTRNQHFIDLTDSLQFDEDPPTIERTISLYDCSAHTSCRSCLQAGQVENGYTCAWCPLSNRCTFNASHPEFGCAATTLMASSSTTTPASSGNWLKASHLASSLDPGQASVFGLSIVRPAKCPSQARWSADETSLNSDTATELSIRKSVDQISASHQQQEILIPNLSHRSVQIPLSPSKSQLIVSGNKRANQVKLECLFDIEMAKARVNAKFVHHDGQSTPSVVCQEIQFSYQEEIATQRAQVTVILNENQAIETNEVILYKCHLFGVSPPALTSTLANSVSPSASNNPGGQNGFTSHQHQQLPLQQYHSAPHHSSAAWRAHELFQLTGYVGGVPGQSGNSALLAGSGRHTSGPTSDCSLCANIERKYQCVWCQNQCQHQDSCLDGHQIAMGSSSCPPPRIDSIHPTSGPLEGGTLITIEGSNLGSNEREIQDKITVAGEPCQLVMYSVSTRIVCKTGPSLHGSQAATVFVGNRAGVTSAHDKFHYKLVFLTDVSPKVGPVSGGTRLYLTGSNLNVGSRTQIFLNDIPCTLDLNEMASNQISCITAPFVGTSMRIERLTLMIDNMTHHLPFPFTYKPDPIITSIEPAESFVSGGRRIVITGHHLSSPQSIKLMVYHDHKHNIVNATNCEVKSDDLIHCLTPAIPKDLIYSSFTLDQHLATSNNDQLSSGVSHQSSINSPFSYESGGFKMKMSLFMDDVRSVRNLDEYYHHLPHHITYYDDPILFRLANQLVEYSDELVISGENLAMKHLEKDMLVLIGHENWCLIKSIQANQVICEPPNKVFPLFDPNTGRLLDRVNLPIEGLIGSHLRFSIGSMQYTSQQYLPASNLPPITSITNQHPTFVDPAGILAVNYDAKSSMMNPGDSAGSAILLTLSIIGFVIGLIASVIFALSRLRQSKSEREYKRIQLQMGSLDINGQPINGFLDTIHVPPNQGVQNNRSFAYGAQQMTSRALDYLTGATNNSKNKLLYPIGRVSFPPSPLTDISSLTGSANHIVHNQQLVKLTPNGSIVNSIRNPSSISSQQLQQQQQQQSLYSGGSIQVTSGSDSSSQSSPGSSTRITSPGQQQRPQQARISNGSSRNYSWTQEAPSTVLSYSVIEACNLTLEGKNAIKDYV